MDSEKNAKFRELLNRPGMVVAGVAYDALSARILDQAGFELLAMGGNSTMASLIGYPDLGIATQTEMIGRARQIAARVDAPMYCDADTGYGDLPSIRRTVVDYEAAGANGIHLEDQTMPKKCGAMEGVTVIPVEQMLDKIKVAVNSRKDPNFIIIARTDCYNSMGIDESIRRCKLFYEAGADVVMPENIKSKAEWAKLGNEMARCGIPAMIDLIDDDQISWTNKECEEINDPENVVSEMLAGIEISERSLKYIPGFEVITRREPNKNKVAIISGGGSGHEPAHAGYVGLGMLDAAVAGNVFASPSPDRILEAIHQVGGEKGILLVIKNYSGDIMNFGMAAELAEMEGFKVMSVITRDDVAVPESTYSTGRRGIAGTVFVHKIAGAAAEAGRSLEDVRDIAQKVIDNTRSMGMAMSPCILPGVGKPGFALAEDEIEIGMGIHGEPGVQRTGAKSSKELAEILCSRILADMDFSNSECAVMINGLGGTPLMELYVLTRDVNVLLKEKGIQPVRWYVGNYMTSLEMSGCSISLLKLDDEMKNCLDAKARTAAWRE